MCIMGGDFNASTTGGRSGYAESNKVHMEAVDKLFQDFIQQTDGVLLAPEAPSRKDDVVEKAAKLDHAVVWNLSVTRIEGQVDWVGAPLHDHARLMYQMAEDDFRVKRDWKKTKEISTPRINDAQWRELQQDIATGIGGGGMSWIDGANGNICDPTCAGASAGA